MSRSSIIGSLLCVAAFASVSCNNAAPPRPVAPRSSEAVVNAAAKRPAVSERAINSVQGETIATPEGRSFKLSEFRGQVIVVDFWATWCAPCREQAPQLAQLSQRYRDKGVQVIGLSLNERTDQSEVQDFIKTVGMTYTIGYADDRVSAAFLSGTEDETGSPPIPQLFIFGKDGRLVEHLIGFNQSHGLAFLDRVVNEQLSR